MTTIDEVLAKNILIRKSDLEQLGIFVMTREESEYKYTLKPYETMAEFDLHTSVSLLLGLHPNSVNNYQHINYKSTEIAIITAIRNNELRNSEILRNEDYNNSNEARVNRIYLERWAKHFGYRWELPPYKPFNPDIETDQQLPQEQANNADEVARLNAIIQQQADTIAQLEQSLKNAELQSVATEDKQRRTSQPQKTIFTLLTLKNYPNCQSRNELFNLINADLKANGIITSDIKYPTLDRLIDEDIRLGEGIKKSPFPPKQK